LLAERRTEDDQADATTSHLKTIKTPEQIAEEAKQAQAEAARQAAEAAAAAHRAKEAEEAGKAQVTTDRQVAIMNLASRDDQDVATLSRRAQKEIKDNDDGEVVIPLR
jgi:transposase